jgi:predicted tellurium resistance membrane protein TerC
MKIDQLEARRRPGVYIYMRHMYMSNLVFVLVNYFPLISSLCIVIVFWVQFDLILMQC